MSYQFIKYEKPEEHIAVVTLNRPERLNALSGPMLAEVLAAVQEIERVGKDQKYILVESYRNESEKANLLYWQLTCESFYSPEEWEWIYRDCGYTGDFGFIYFE